MENTDLDFNGRLKYEQFEFFFRHHWVSFFRCFARSLLIILISSLVIVPAWILMNRMGANQVSGIMAIIMMAGIFLIMNMLCISLINHFFTMIIMTDCRMIIVHKTLYLRNDHDTIDLQKIQDIGVEARGLLHNYLQYGRLVITLSSGHTPIVIEYTPRPHEILERTNRIKRMYIIARQQRRQGFATDESEIKTEGGGMLSTVIN